MPKDPTETADTPELGQTNAGQTTPGQTAAEKPPRRRRYLRWTLLLLGPILVLVGAAYFYLSGGRYVSTDNAYVYLD